MAASNHEPGEGYGRGAAACQRYQIAPRAFLPPSCLLASLLMPSAVPGHRLPGAETMTGGALGHTERAGGFQGTGRKEMDSPEGAALLSGNWDLCKPSQGVSWLLHPNQDTTTCKAKLRTSPPQTYKICPAKMCPSTTWQSRRGLSKLCASMDDLIPLGNHVPHGTRGFLRSLATQAIAGFSDPAVPSGTGRSDGEGLRGARDGASREGAVPASLRGAGGRGQWRNPIWQSL